MGNRRWTQLQLDSELLARGGVYCRYGVANGKVVSRAGRVLF